MSRGDGTTMGQRAPTTTAELQAMAPVLQVEGQLKANAQEIQNAQRGLADMERQIGQYQGRLNQAPLAEQQMSDLTRDYEQSKENYDAILKKQMQSQMATNLQKRQQGQQFRIIDPPSLPHRAASPDRMMFSGFGLLGGLLLGLGCLALMENIDESVRGSDVKHAGIKVLVGVPHLVMPEEEQRLKRLQAAEWVAGALMVIAILLGNAFTFCKG